MFVVVQHIADALTLEPDSVPRELLSRYQSLVGALLYCATQTRPDVAYAVGMLCRAMSRPTEELYLDAIRVLCYLHRTRALGLTYRPDQADVAGYSDSDWAGCRVTGMSTSGEALVIGSHLIKAWCRTPNHVTLSSAEAELYAMVQCTAELIGIKSMMHDWGEISQA